MGTFQKNLSQVALRGGKVSWSARSCLCCQSREGSRMLRLVLLSATLTCCLAAEFSTSESFVVKGGKTKKTATCDITISYEGVVVSEADSSVSCSVVWPKNSVLNFAKTLSVTLGDVSADVFTADFAMTLSLLILNSIRPHCGAHKWIISSGVRELLIRASSRNLLQQDLRSVLNAAQSSPMRLEIHPASLGP